MSDPWQILGLSRDSATEKEVKSAYARLIKQHRPDTDPEGFQRVRQAYEAALAMLKNGPAAERAPEPVIEEDAPTASAPPDLIEAELAVHRAREAGDQEAMASALSDLYPLCRALRPGKAGIQLWRETLHRVTEGRTALVVLGVKIPQMIDELESGGAVVTHAVLGFWEGTRDTERLITMAEAVMADTARLGNQDSAIVALRLGLEIGFLRPALATALITFAFPHVDRQARDQLIPQVEQQATLGNLMSGLRREQTAFWHERLRNPRHSWDWKDKASQDALDYLAREAAPRWSGFGIIRQVAPPDWFARLEKEMGKRQGGFVGKFRPTTLGNLRPVKKASKARSFARYAWLILILLSIVVRVISESQNSYTNTSRNTSTSYPRPPSYSQTLTLSGNTFPNSVPSHLPPNQNAMSKLAIGLSQPSIADAAMQRFKAEFGSGDSAAPESGSASDTPALPNPLQVKAKARADRMLQDDRTLHIWVESANAIGSKAMAQLKGLNDKTQRDAVWKKSWQELYKLMHKMHDASPGKEQHLLDFLAWNPDSTRIEREAALIRMTETEPADTFLPTWEGVAQMESEVGRQVSFVAGNFLKANSIAILTTDERARIEALANRRKQ